MDFIKNENGAVTVDWTVLTASLVGLGIATMGVVSIGVQDTSNDIRAQLDSEGLIKTSFASVFNFSFTDFSDTSSLVNGIYFPRTGTYSGWAMTHGAYANPDDAPSTHNLYIQDVDGTNTVELWSNGGSNPMGISQTIENMEDGDTYTLTFDASAQNLAWDSDAGSYVETGNVAGIEAEIYFGGQLVQTVEPNSTSLTGQSIELVAGSGDGSNVLEVRKAPDGFRDKVYVANFDIQPN